MDSSPPVADAIHPCVKCGACCATYRVLFDRSEVQNEAYNVPKDLTEKIDAKNLAIIGTNQQRPRCIALEGHIGKSVGCTIYTRRPSCCREFVPSYEEGLQNPRCDSARRGKGMKALTPRDWVEFRRSVVPEPRPPEL